MDYLEHNKLVSRIKQIKSRQWDFKTLRRERFLTEEEENEIADLEKELADKAFSEEEISCFSKIAEKAGGYMPVLSYENWKEERMRKIESKMTPLLRKCKLLRDLNLNDDVRFSYGEEGILLDSECALRELNLTHFHWESLYGWFLDAVKRCNFLVLFGSKVVELNSDGIEIIRNDPQLDQNDFEFLFENWTNEASYASA